MEPHSSYGGLRKRALALLASIRILPEKAWQQELHQIFLSDEMNGPLVVAWVCQQMIKISPPPPKTPLFGKVR